MTATGGRATRVRRRPPRALRRATRDPRRDAEALLDDATRMVECTSAARAAWAPHPPVLVTAAVSADAARLASADPRVDVLTPDELFAAAQRAGINLDAARAADGPALQGFVSALRGTAGELHTLERLAAGDLASPAGTVRGELVAHHHPGVDLAFYDAAGRLVDTANVKIAANPDIVLRHFGRYPEVRLVYAPTDTADRLGAMGFHVVRPDGAIPATGQAVIDLGVPTETFDADVRDALAGTVVDVSTPLTQLIPWLGLGAVAVRALRRLASGADPAAVRRHAGDDLLVTGSAASAGNLAAVSFGSVAGAIPFAIVGAWVGQAAAASRRTWVDAARRQRELHDRIAALADESSATAPAASPVTPAVARARKRFVSWLVVVAVVALLAAGGPVLVGLILAVGVSGLMFKALAFTVIGLAPWIATLRNRSS